MVEKRGGIVILVMFGLGEGKGGGGTNECFNSLPPLSS